MRIVGHQAELLEVKLFSLVAQGVEDTDLGQDYFVHLSHETDWHNRKK